VLDGTLMEMRTILSIEITSALHCVNHDLPSPHAGATSHHGFDIVAVNVG
jgi:hypothetical protein